MALACLGGPRGRGVGQGSGEAARHPTVRSLSEIYGGDGCSGAPTVTGQVTWKVTAGGGTWDVPVWVPKGAGPRKGVIALHGGGGTGPVYVRNSGWDVVAREAGALLVAPTAAFSKDGLVRGAELWNNGRWAPGERTLPRNDVALLNAIADAMEKEACVDGILGAGFSDGAAMIMTWSCRSERHPDAMVVSSALLLPAEGGCTSKRPVPYRLYMGEEDPRMSTGAELNRPDAPPAPETTRFFAEANRCGAETRPERQAPRTVCDVYQGCRAATELCVVERMGHAWPRPDAADVDAARDGFAWFLENVRRAP